jgi:hypothetical protein
MHNKKQNNINDQTTKHHIAKSICPFFFRLLLVFFPPFSFFFFFQTKKNFSLALATTSIFPHEFSHHQQLLAMPCRLPQTFLVTQIQLEILPLLRSWWTCRRDRRVSDLQGAKESLWSTQKLEKFKLKFRFEVCF